MSVIVKDISGEHTMVCKGAVEEILSICNYTEVDEKSFHSPRKYVQMSKTK